MTASKAELKGCDLKKQSQFMKGQNDAKSILTMVYGDLDDCRLRKNKPNSKSIKLVPSTTFRAGSEQSRMEPIRQERIAGQVW